MPGKIFRIPRKWQSAIAAVSLGLLSAAVVYTLPDIEVEARLFLHLFHPHSPIKSREQLRYDSWIGLNFSKLDTASYDWLFAHRGPHEPARDRNSEPIPSIPEVVIVSITPNAEANLINPEIIPGKEDPFPEISALRARVKISYPFPRSVYAVLLRKLKAAGAAVIGIDYLFGEASGYNLSREDPTDDREFARAVKECGNVVLAAKSTPVSDRSGFAFQGQASDFPVNDQVGDIPGPRDAMLRDSARASGFINLPQDNLDSWVRRFHFSEEHADPDDMTLQKSYPTFAAVIAALYWNDYRTHRPTFRKISKEQFRQNLLDELSRGRFLDQHIYLNKKDSQTLGDDSSANICFAGYPGNSTCRTVPIDQVLNRANADRLTEWFRNKIVLIGTNDREDQDSYSTPLYQTMQAQPVAQNETGASNQAADVQLLNTEGEKRFGVEIHANIVHTLLAHHYYRAFDERRRLALILLCGLVTAFLTLRLKPLLALLPSLAIIAGIQVLMLFAFSRFQFMRPTQIVLATLMSYFTETGYFYLIEERKARLARSTFQRYVGPKVMEQVLDTDFKPGTVESRYLTIMFTDVQGFTSLSEKMPPVEVVATFNRYLNQMVEIIDRHGGTLDKIMGDGVMAYFNAPLPVLNHEQKAVECALEMQKAMREWRKMSIDLGLPPLKVRIGINAGEVVFGEVGAKRQLGYTVIGDAVNAAARLEPLNKEFGTDILISEVVRDKIDPALKTDYVGKLEIRGRKEGIRAYSVSGFEAETDSSQLAK